MVKKEIAVIGVLVLLLGVLIFVIFNLQERYKTKLNEHETKIEAIGKKLAVVSNARVTLQQALKRSIRKKGEYKQVWQEEAKRKEVLDEQLKSLSLDMAQAKSELRNLGVENSSLKTKVEQLEQEKNHLNDRVAYFSQMQDKLQLKIKRLLTRTKVELGQVVVTPSSLNGKILKANRLYNFVIIDLGKNDGIKKDTNLVAYREGKPIGEIIIEKIYDELCVGKAAFNWLGNELDVGDIVRGKE